MREVYKNDVIVPYEDAGGVTNTHYEGDNRLGNDFFTGDPLADTDAILSRRLVCDRCGCPVKNKDELIKQNGFLICPKCIDEPQPY